MINNRLLNGAASLLAGNSFTIPGYLAFGSTSATLTATDIITSGEFDREALISKTSDNNIVKYIGSRTGVGANNEIINVISLVNSGTAYGSSDICANMLIPSLIHSSDFDVGAEFWFTLNRG